MKNKLPSDAGFNASGGIITTEFTKALIQAGADVIGTSSAVSLLSQ